jgi:hypothetical protein
LDGPIHTRGGKNVIVKFETAVITLDTHEVLGVISWGYEIPGNLVDNIKLDVPVVNKTPSKEFKDAVAKANTVFPYKVGTPMAVNGGSGLIGGVSALPWRDYQIETVAELRETYMILKIISGAFLVPIILAAFFPIPGVSIRNFDGLRAGMSEKQVDIVFGRVCDDEVMVDQGFIRTWNEKKIRVLGCFDEKKRTLVWAIASDTDFSWAKSLQTESSIPNRMRSIFSN